ncbi:MAG: hypothetical protein ACI4TK_18855 [Agathobacter sp.]
MRFKYYLKGLGMGIIVTTIIMTVSCVVHNNNLSDEEIIERAMKLGMVISDSEKEPGNGSFEGHDKESSESEADSESEGEPQSCSEITTEPPAETEDPVETEEPVETGESETQMPPQHVEVTQYVLHIQWGDTPRMIANELYENGMVDSASEFRKYLADNGYSGKLRSGSYTIMKGMTYEEIAKLITKK